MRSGAAAGCGQKSWDGFGLRNRRPVLRSRRRNPRLLRIKCEDAKLRQIGPPREGANETTTEPLLTPEQYRELRPGTRKSENGYRGTLRNEKGQIVYECAHIHMNRYSDSWSFTVKGYVESVSALTVSTRGTTGCWPRAI